MRMPSSKIAGSRGDACVSEHLGSVVGEGARLSEADGFGDAL
jgi:hypothetical protein